jgi:hypothetical protein
MSGAATFKTPELTEVLRGFGGAERQEGGYV